MSGRFELFEHTADLGVRVLADDLPGLVFESAKGLYATLGELVPESGERRRETLRFSGSAPTINRALLLRDFVAELLYRFEVCNEFVVAVEVRSFTDESLEVVCEFALCDRKMSELYHEVKAVSYHDLALERIEPVPQDRDGGSVFPWRARFVVDI